MVWVPVSTQSVSSLILLDPDVPLADTKAKQMVELYPLEQATALCLGQTLRRIDKSFHPFARTNVKIEVTAIDGNRLSLNLQPRAYVLVPPAQLLFASRLDRQWVSIPAARYMENL